MTRVRRLITILAAFMLTVIFFVGPRAAHSAPASASFRDCAACPEMVVVPAGSFLMGADRGRPAELPVRRVVIARAFAMSKFEITFDEWAVCVAAAGCENDPDDHGWGRGARPVINVSWEDAVAFTRYLSARTGHTYRLATEAEWEYAARAGTQTDFWWGDRQGEAFANCRSCGSEWDGRGSAPVGSFPPNPLGLHDMNGNVSEWTGDCWNANHRGAAEDGAARTSGDCSRRVTRSGSWYYIPKLMAASARARYPATLWSYTIGLRVVRELTGGE
jgi:formylglycine-generating enzyme required for sulfatase activity